MICRDTSAVGPMNDIENFLSSCIYCVPPFFFFKFREGRGTWNEVGSEETVA